MATTIKKHQETPDTKTEGKSYPPLTYKAVNSLRSDKRSLQAMAAELIDNSKDAKATKVNVTVLGTEKNNYVDQIVIADNGVGMCESTLEGSYHLGFEREYSPHDIGKFGLGGTKSCLEKADRKRTITSDDGKRLLGRTYDMDEVKKENLFFSRSLEELHVKELWGKYSLDSDNSGTVIEISKPLSKTRWKNKKPEFLRHLGETFRNFIQNGELEINVKFPDDKGFVKVKPTCPAGSDLPNAKVYSEPLEYDGKTIGSVTQIDLSDCDFSRQQITSLNAKAGIYITRGGRLIAGPMLQGEQDWKGTRKRHPHLRFARVLIDFPVEQDDIFRITNKKEGVQPDDRLMDAIGNIINPFFVQSSRMTEQRSTRRNAQGAGKVLQRGRLNANKPFMNPTSKANKSKGSTKLTKPCNVVPLKNTSTVKRKSSNNWVENISVTSWGDEAVPWKYDAIKKEICFNEDNIFIKTRFLNQPEALQETIRDFVVAMISADQSHQHKLQDECPDQQPWHTEFIEQFYKKLRGTC